MTLLQDNYKNYHKKTNNFFVGFVPGSLLYIMSVLTRDQQQPKVSEPADGYIAHQLDDSCIHPSTCDAGLYQSHYTVVCQRRYCTIVRVHTQTEPS